MAVVAIQNQPVGVVTDCFLAASFMNCHRDRYAAQCPRFYVDQGYEMDVIGVRHSMFIDEIEIKLSRADFLADFKKVVWLHRGKTGSEAADLFRQNAKATKHDLLKSGDLPPNYFSFLMPDEVAQQCEKDIPEHAGLYTFSITDRWGGPIREVKPSPRLHHRKMPVDQYTKLLRKMAVRYQYKFIDENREIQPNPPTEDKD